LSKSDLKPLPSAGGTGLCGKILVITCKFPSVYSSAVQIQILSLGRHHKERKWTTAH
jgi:hypothetical protein